MAATRLVVSEVTPTELGLAACPQSLSGHSQMIAAKIVVMTPTRLCSKHTTHITSLGAHSNAGGGVQERKLRHGVMKQPAQGCVIPAGLEPRRRGP